MRRLSWIVLFAITLAAPAFAQEASSAQTMLPHCMAALKPEAQTLAGGRCLGILATLSFVSRVLPDNLKFCHPGGATPDLMLQAINTFVEANPEAAAQDFRLIALAAMRNKWPCQE